MRTSGIHTVDQSNILILKGFYTFAPVVADSAFLV